MFNHIVSTYSGCVTVGGVGTELCYTVFSTYSGCVTEGCEVL